METGHNSLRCSGVCISGLGISKLEGGKVVRTIPRERIKEIKLSFDSDSRHPFCQFFGGFTMVALGLIMEIACVIMGSDRATSVNLIVISLGIRSAMASFWGIIGLGLWSLIGVFRAKYHLLITTESGTRRLFFEKSSDKREIRQFIRRACQEFGYEIDASILEDRPAAE